MIVWLCISTDGMKRTKNEQSYWLSELFWTKGFKLGTQSKVWKNDLALMWNEFSAKSHEFPLEKSPSSRTLSFRSGPILGVEAKGCFEPHIVGPIPSFEELVIFALIRVCKLNSNLIESVGRICETQWLQVYAPNPMWLPSMIINWMWESYRIHDPHTSWMLSHLVWNCESHC